MPMTVRLYAGTQPLQNLAVMLFHSSEPAETLADQPPVEVTDR